MREPFVLTLEGQYIIKNVVLVSAAVVGWGMARQRALSPLTSERRRT